MLADAAASNEFERVEYFLKADGHWSACQTCLRRSRRPFGSTDRYVRGDVEATDNRGRQSAFFGIWAMHLRLSTLSCSGTVQRGRERTPRCSFSPYGPARLDAGTGKRLDVRGAQGRVRRVPASG